MAEPESYVTKRNPTLEDWLAYNSGIFAVLQGREGAPKGPLQYAPLSDAHIHASQEGIGVREYYEKLQAQIGPLGDAALKLVHSDMDGAWHITIGYPDQSEV